MTCCLNPVWVPQPKAPLPHASAPQPHQALHRSNALRITCGLRPRLAPPPKAPCPCATPTQTTARCSRLHAASTPLSPAYISPQPTPRSHTLHTTSPSSWSSRPAAHTPLHPAPPHQTPRSHTPLPHLAHDLSKQLVLQTFGRDGEVDDGDLDADLGQVVRIGHLGCHIEVEVGVVVDVRVTQANERAPALRFEGLRGPRSGSGWVTVDFHIAQPNEHAPSLYAA
eukprot:360969-Chlamydomonas_euryale.AAC.3